MFDSSYTLFTSPSFPSFQTNPVGHLSFNLTNRANSYRITCSLASQDFLSYLLSGIELDIWYDCASITPDQWSASVPPAVFRERPEYRISTFVKFDKPAARLPVNQAWYCDKDVRETYVSSRVLLYLYAHEA